MNPTGFYTIVDHTADVGIELEAAGKPEVFAAAALAMFDLMYGLEAISEKETWRIEVKAESDEELLVAWLNEILYIHAVEKLLFAGFTEATLSEGAFSALGHGERFDPIRHKGDMEIKAATYHRLLLEKQKAGWKARIIFDV